MNKAEKHVIIKLGTPNEEKFPIPETDFGKLQCFKRFIIIHSSNIKRFLTVSH